MALTARRGSRPVIKRARRRESAGSSPTLRVRDSIVVVDDSPDLLEIYEEMLTLDGWEVRAFPSATEALDSIDADVPDVVMTDINLGTLTGRGLARALRADARTENLLIVAASGSVGPSDRLLQAFDAFFQKPVEIATLSVRLRALVDEHRGPVGEPQGA